MSMQLIGFICLIIAFTATVVSAFSGIFVLVGRAEKRRSRVCFAEYGQTTALFAFGLASVVLLRALVNRDFSFEYVASYTDSFLPLFYTITAFWAGQAGSLLFWAVCVAFLAGYFAHTKAYAELTPETRAWFWLLHGILQVFFLMLLIGPSSPFIGLNPAPADGNGLNPLLRNPGMVFHPPLLFLGYAGFCVPACVAVAVRMTGDKKGWFTISRNWCLVAWGFLSAGIILGSWWAYMELGWGGYWAWDPVENASLIPWIASTAFLHVLLISKRRAALHSTSFFLLLLSLWLCFLATYTVRSGVIDSLHSFGDGGVGMPLLLFLIFMFAFCIAVLFFPGTSKKNAMDELSTRSGLLFCAVWLLLVIAFVVLIGTFWPVISSLWSQNPQGMEASFYNKVCLPLFTLLACFLVVCPWFGWKGGIAKKGYLAVVLGLSLCAAGVLFALGMRSALPLAGATAGIGVTISTILFFVANPGLGKRRIPLGTHAIHMGVALMVIGIAWSGPYSVSKMFWLNPQETAELEGYSFTYTEYKEEANEAKASFSTVLKVKKDGKFIGTLTPIRQAFRNFETRAFADVSVIPSLGNEIYATVIEHKPSGKARFKLSINPLVNWIWIGGVLVSICPFLILGRRKEKKG